MRCVQLTGAAAKALIREPRPIVDKSGTIFAALAGQPNDLSYECATYEALDLIMQEGRGAAFSRSEKLHRRGYFPALAVGISYGKGQRQPMKLRNGVHTAMLQRLVGASCIQRLALFANGEFYNTSMHSLY